MSTTRLQPSADLSQALERALRAGPRSAAQLMAALGVSQPTLSRTIQRLAGSVSSFRIKGDRTPRYAWLRALPQGLGARQRIYRCTSSGHLEPFAEVEFLAGGATLERSGHAVQLYEGLPPYMSFAAPSGFLGRQQAHEASKTPGFPASLKDWSDDHRVLYLFTQGMNLPGNLVFGDGAVQREMDFRTLEPTPAEEDLAHYVGMASQLRAAAWGSSAGGEQPKFLWLTGDARHVIVKFAKQGSRMAELLPLEHLALRALGEVGIPASRTQLLTAGGHVFLEVERFDRIGRHGRVGLLSAGAVDDEVYGRRDSWSEFAARCVQDKYLSAEAARQVDTMAAFSELIGNNDRHFENLSLLIGEDGEYQGLAPAYDILPMRYASIGGGIDPDLSPIEPKVGPIGAQPEVWAQAFAAAERFWLAAQHEDLPVPLSSAMKTLAASNLARARAFVAPLRPAAYR
ncbi:HipA domain-containing protein [Roseateles sp. BYS180W]|uniref:HipA domain-containing protein n=1 Tax=Roseateles rivi TaxID=3299028 RepID=A0ABW7FUA9_9BURK